MGVSSGAMGLGVRLVMPMARSLPLRTMGKLDGPLEMSICTWLPITSVTAGSVARKSQYCEIPPSNRNSSAAPEPDGRMVSGVFVLDQKSRVLYKNGTPIDLTQVEFQIMELFFANPGVALVREKILEGVWGENYFGDVKIVDVNIRRLRMKIEDEPSAPKHILTVWGYGYRWNA